MFLISALLLEGAFQMLTHFYNLWSLGQKSIILIFDRGSGCKIIKQNVAGGLIFSDFSTMYMYYP